jgi:hypothetical protein
VDRRMGRRAGLHLLPALTLAASSILSPPAVVWAAGSAATAEDGAPRPCSPVAPFRASDFSHPYQIDNPWLPMTPGTQLMLAGEAGQGNHQIVVTVTNLTKVIAGLQTLVVLDNDFQDGQLAESELAFFAQDDRGNVWNVGEYPEEYEDGVLVGAPSTWLAGVADAVPGVGMRAMPRRGTGWYLQGSVPSIEFLDCAKVFKVHQDVCAPVGCDDDALVIDERSPLDPTSGSQRKYYARGLGNVRIDAVGDKEGETLELASRITLSASALAAVDAVVHTMDARGHGVAEVYARSSPLIAVPTT